jgi:hypothetical protein
MDAASPVMDNGLALLPMLCLLYRVWWSSSAVERMEDSCGSRLDPRRGLVGQRSATGYWCLRTTCSGWLSEQAYPRTSTRRRGPNTAGAILVVHVLDDCLLNSRLIAQVKAIEFRVRVAQDSGRRNPRRSPVSCLSVSERREGWNM